MPAECRRSSAGAPFGAPFGAILIRMDELRIPKVAVSIVCYTIRGESFSGKVFLDMITSAGFSTSQILEFFNSSQIFFPIKLDEGKGVVLQKESLFRVDVPELFQEYQTEVSSLLDFKRETILHFATVPSLRGDLIVDMPIEHARVLDVLNSGRIFIPVLLETTLSLINVHHILKVEEV
jgi:hypothetical protein